MLLQKLGKLKEVTSSTGSLGTRTTDGGTAGAPQLPASARSSLLKMLAMS